MKEMHTLISAYVGPTHAAHAYVASRFKNNQNKEIEQRACERLGKCIDDAVGAANWLPALMITPLDGDEGKWIKLVEDVLRQEANMEVLRTIANFQSKRNNFMFTAWFMESSNEDCKKLMAIH